MMDTMTNADFALAVIFERALPEEQESAILDAFPGVVVTHGDETRVAVPITADGAREEVREAMRVLDVVDSLAGLAGTRFEVETLAVEGVEQ